MHLEMFHIFPYVMHTKFHIRIYGFFRIYDAYYDFLCINSRFDFIPLWPLCKETVACALINCILSKDIHCCCLKPGRISDALALSCYECLELIWNTILIQSFWIACETNRLAYASIILPRECLSFAEAHFFSIKLHYFSILLVTIL